MNKQCLNRLEGLELRQLARTLKRKKEYDKYCKMYELHENMGSFRSPVLGSQEVEVVKPKLVSIIYFVQGQSTGLIKIGLTTNLSARFSDLQVGSPDVLRVIGIHRGTIKSELMLHKLFANHRVRGEWFRPDESILNFVKTFCYSRPYPTPNPTPDGWSWRPTSGNREPRKAN